MYKILKSKRIIEGKQKRLRGVYAYYTLEELYNLKNQKEHFRNRTLLEFLRYIGALA